MKDILDWLPTIAMLVAVAAAWGALRHKVERVVEDFKELKGTFSNEMHGLRDAVLERLSALKERAVRTETEVQTLNKEMHAVRDRVDDVSHRVATLQGRDELTPPPWRWPPDGGKP